MRLILDPKTNDALYVDLTCPARMAMCRLADRTALLTLLFSPGGRVRRVRRMVHRRHNELALQKCAVGVPRFIGSVIHATNVQRDLPLGICQYNVPCLQNVHTFWV